MYESLSKYIDSTELGQLSALRLRSIKRLSGVMSGEHASFRMGQAVEFAQHRQYTPGDDLRYIDWKIFGRTDKYYLKQSEDETDLLCYVLVDCSESMSFAGPMAEKSKLQFAKQLAMAFAFVAIGAQDRFAVGLIADGLKDYLPPTNSAEGIAQLDEAFEQTDGSGSTDLRRAVAQFADAAPASGLVILISDLLGQTDSIAPALTFLQTRGHDAIVLHVMDRAEHDFDFDGQLRLIGLESAGQTDVNGTYLRAAYRQEVKNFIMSQQQTCWNLGFAYATVLTDRPLMQSLSQFINH